MTAGEVWVDETEAFPSEPSALELLFVRNLKQTDGEVTRVQDDFARTAAETGALPEAAWHPELEDMYRTHFRDLGRFAYVLMRDEFAAEDVVAGAFLKFAEVLKQRKLQDPTAAYAYIRQIVFRDSMTIYRRTGTAERKAPLLLDIEVGADDTVEGALMGSDGAAVRAAIRSLPDRQREAVVLRYYADLSEAEIADAMEISRGAVKSHTSRGMAALRAALEHLAA